MAFLNGCGTMINRYSSFHAPRKWREILSAAADLKYALSFSINTILSLSPGTCTFPVRSALLHFAATQNKKLPDDPYLK
jgi:hypothetical protein